LLFSHKFPWSGYAPSGKIGTENHIIGQRYTKLAQTRPFTTWHIKPVFAPLQSADSQFDSYAVKGLEQSISTLLRAADENA
jgi:hypothetical protein